MRQSTRADTLSDASPEPTATALDHEVFEEDRTIEDAAMDDADAPSEPPTAKLWLPEFLPDDLAATTVEY